MNIIEKTLIAHEVEQKDIPFERKFQAKERWTCLHKGKSLRYFRVKGAGWYHCHCKQDQKGEPHSWASPHSWCIIDLYQHKIRYSWHESCQYCEKRQLPRFPLESINVMAEYAVKQYLKRLQGEDSSNCDSEEENEEDTNRGPHQTTRCGMCRDLKRPCWISKSHKIKYNFSSY